MKTRFAIRKEFFSYLIKDIKTNKIPLDFRLFLFLSILVLTIILGVIVILFITGVFTAGLSEQERMLENELAYLSHDISKQYGDFSLQALDFSKQLSSNIEKEAEKLGIPISDIENHPEAIEEVISGGFNHSLFALQKSKSSGVFFILNATINPNHKNAINSKAGLYLKNMEPNIISSSSPNIITLRGIPSISRNNMLPLHVQWAMEFDVSDAPYYHRPIQAAINNNTLPLSRLYYWTSVLTLPNTSEEIMLCSVPLLDTKGNVFGVCGLEVSSMLFKLSHMPANNIYNRLFYVLSPINENIINLNNSMFAGGYSARLISNDNTNLRISKNHQYFYSYKYENNTSFIGIHTPINIYPEESVFSDEEWIAAIMVPEQDMVSSITIINLLLIFGLMLLVILGIIVSFILSRKISKPITEGLDIIKCSDLSIIPRTNIPEINDLIDFLAAHNEELYEKAKQNDFSLSMLDEFVKSAKALSPAERSVFDLYVEEHTAKEAADILCLSINTIKTHNKHIYSKLNVSSREELALYIKMLQEIGAEF